MLNNFFYLCKKGYKDIFKRFFNFENKRDVLSLIKIKNILLQNSRIISSNEDLFLLKAHIVALIVIIF